MLKEDNKGDSRAIVALSSGALISQTCAVTAPRQSVLEVCQHEQGVSSSDFCRPRRSKLS